MATLEWDFVIFDNKSIDIFYLKMSVERVFIIIKLIHKSLHKIK